MNTPSQAKAILKASDLRFSYGKNSAEILSGVDIQVALGEFVCILGPNGCGKTTLLKCLCGLLDSDSGQVQINSLPLDKYSPRRLAKVLSYVPQSVDISFEFTTDQLVAMGRTAHMGPLGLGGDLDRRVCAAAMEMTGSARLKGRMFSSLSGGEKQTVMIARALAQQPQIMLLDEPTSSLDLRHQLDIYQMMARLAHQWQIAVICVSHDINMAARFADRLTMLSTGKVEADGKPADVVREDIISKIYGVNVRLIDRGDSSGVPLVLAE